eukprot:7381163-Prymnesium_polylepis.1
MERLDPHARRRLSHVHPSAAYSVADVPRKRNECAVTTVCSHYRSAHVWACRRGGGGQVLSLVCTLVYHGTPLSLRARHCQRPG